MKAANTRKKLLKAATAAFASKGYAGASIREITSAADANVAAVSYHFGDKVGLYTAVVQQALATGLPDNSELADETLSVETRLQGFLRQLLERMRLNTGSHLRQIIAREEASPSGVLGPVFAQLLRPRHRETVAFFAQAIGVRADHPEAHRTLKTLVDAVKGYVRDEALLKALEPQVYAGKNADAEALESLVAQGLDLIEGARRRARGAQ